jgi:hypothetical protein
MSEEKKEEKEEQGTKRPKRLLVYIGREAIDDDAKKLSYAYYSLDDDWERWPLPKAKPTSLFKTKIGWSRPGQVVEVEYEAGNPGTVYPGTGKVVGSYPSQTCTELVARSDAIEVAHRQRQLAAKEADRDLAWERLEPFAVAYRRIRTHDRAAFLANVIAQITGRAL